MYTPERCSVYWNLLEHSMGLNNQATIPTMVMELMDCNLYEFILSKQIPLQTVLSLLHDVSLGVQYLHCRNPPIIHCNLSPRSVLVNTNPIVAKISDLGSAQCTKGDEKAPGTIAFMPPEAFAQEPLYGLPLDVFSYGGVALYGVVKEWPEPSERNISTMKTIQSSEVERRRQYLDKMIGEAAVLRPLVEECLADDPAKRPTMEMVSERIKEMKASSSSLKPRDELPGRPSPAPSTGPHHQQQPTAPNNGGPSTTDPCPLCGKRFPTIEELIQHAAVCNL